MSLITSLFLFVSACTAAATPVRRDCTTSWPSYPHTPTLNTIYAICVERNVNEKVLLATFETAWVETRVWPLDCGDQDSVGVFQQRPSQGWGTVEQCMDTVYATNKFLDQAIWNDSQFPNMTAGELAQSVQISDYPMRYQENEAIGIQLVAQARANAAAIASSSSSTSRHLYDNFIELGADGRSVFDHHDERTDYHQALFDVDTGQGDVHSGQRKSAFTVDVGNDFQGLRYIYQGVDLLCVPLVSVIALIGLGLTALTAAIQKTYSVSLAQLRFWNPKIDSSCSNLSKTTYYCAKSKTVAPPSSVASGTIKTGCRTYVLVKSGVTCNSLTSKYKISLSKLRGWNIGLNSKCTNLQANKSYCVSAV
ncbi:hypothetical protein AURDEDRAFT_165312 [Auricularia subglabra TFB-10046 SS5]|nr:hypothetical protein AURDEDRAFT_165312 [Auricularia subglabra TFB-10046 SS5]